MQDWVGHFPVRNWRNESIHCSRRCRGTASSGAHRLSTVASFDRIVVVVDGRVIEDGPPAELRRQGGVYDRLWQIQSEGFETA